MSCTLSPKGCELGKNPTLLGLKIQRHIPCPAVTFYHAPISLRKRTFDAKGELGCKNRLLMCSSNLFLVDDFSPSTLGRPLHPHASRET